MPQELCHLGHQVLCLGACDPRAGDPSDVVCVICLLRDLAPGRSQDAPRPVALDRAAHPPAGDEGDRSRPGRDKGYHPCSVNGSPSVEQGADVEAWHRAADQAESLVRPFERRREIMARPARVRMRVRKPCVFDRRRLFG
jgi:hypothetical protein